MSWKHHLPLLWASSFHTISLQSFSILLLPCWVQSINYLRERTVSSRLENLPVFHLLKLLSKKYNLIHWIKKSTPVWVLIHLSRSPALDHPSMVTLHCICSWIAPSYLYWRARVCMFLSFFASKSQWCLMFKLSSTRTSRSFPAELLLTQSVPSH